MKTYKEQRIAEREDFRRFTRSAILVVFGVLFLVWIIGYGLLHYQNGIDTCMDRGNTRGYCQYLMK